jgi:hypothetical protein
LTGLYTRQGQGKELISHSLFSTSSLWPTLCVSLEEGAGSPVLCNGAIQALALPSYLPYLHLKDLPRQRRLWSLQVAFPLLVKPLLLHYQSLGLSSSVCHPRCSIIGASCLSGIVFWRLRAWRRKSTQGAASVSDKGDLERQKDRWLAPSTTAPLSLDTVAAPPGVAWAPQIRSISGPEPVREDFKPPPPKRSRSPPPLVSKPSQDPFVDPRPKSVPPKSPRTLDVESAIGLSHPSSPPSYALSVSGYQVRGLSTQEKGTRDWED